MASRLADLERKTLLVQFIAVEPFTFFATSDGTDLVQDILRKNLSRSDADIFGQEGSLAIDEQGEFLMFEPSDTNNRTLHLPIEHLAYCGALRRMHRDFLEQDDSNQIHRREFENVDLANRFAHHITGPPIFVAVFHGFDNALCYTFVTQSADDACLLVMKLMRAFKIHEQQAQQQGHSSIPPLPAGARGSPLPADAIGDTSLLQPSQGFFTDNRQALSSSLVHRAPSTVTNSYIQDTRQDDIIQQLLANPNLELVNQPLPIMSPRANDTPNVLGHSVLGQPFPPNASSSLSNLPPMGQLSSQMMRPPSPPIFGASNTANVQDMSLANRNLQVIYRPNNQEVVYKQNIMVRWLQPPTPPPPAPIIIREVRAPAQIQPPIVCRQMAPCPRTPPPIIFREKPPPCPQLGQPLIIEKRLPPMTLPPQVIVERCPPPPSQPQTIIYEKHVPSTAPGPIVIKREVCPTAAYPVVQRMPGRRLVREIVRQIPVSTQPALVCVPPQQAPAQPAVVCVPQQQTVVKTQPPQQLVPVFATKQNIVQPRGLRIIRQVIGPSQGVIQQPQQVYSTTGSPLIQAVPTMPIQ